LRKTEFVFAKLFYAFFGTTIMNDVNSSSFKRTVVMGCCAIAIVSVGASYALQQTAAKQVAKAPVVERDLARGMAALPRPGAQPVQPGSWWARRTDQNATGTAKLLRTGNTLRNPELGMPR
jgi:hypothetical protein